MLMIPEVSKSPTCTMWSF